MFPLLAPPDRYHAQKGRYHALRSYRAAELFGYDSIQALRHRLLARHHVKLHAAARSEKS